MVSTNDTSNLFRQTYTRGLVILFYGLIWLAVILAGYIFLDPFFASSGGAAMTLVIATWASALAGGMGGTSVMLSRLYRHMAIEQDFRNQGLVSYLLQPIIGVVIGGVVLYLIVIPAALIVNFAVRREFLFEAVLTSSTFVAIQILLSWVGGFYQQQGLEKIKSLAQSGKVADQSLESLDKDSSSYYKDSFFYRQTMFRWSYTWGLFIFFYGILWLVGLAIAYLATTGLVSGLEGSSHTKVTALVLAAWPVAAAGGIGGVFSLLKDLHEHVSIKQDFHRRHLMAYLVKPITGFALGFAMFFLLASGYLAIRNEDGNQIAIDSGSVVMLQLLLGWIAGFRQQTVTDFIHQLIQSIVSFFKRIGHILITDPKALFKKAGRDKVLKEIAEDTSLFSEIKLDDPPPTNQK